MTRELSPKAGAALLRETFKQSKGGLTHTEALDLLAKLKGYEAWSHFKSASAKTRKTAPPTARVAGQPGSLEQVLQAHYGSWGEFSALPIQDWSYEVLNGDTRLGYWDWVVATLRARDLLGIPEEYCVRPPAEVTLPDGTPTTWDIETNLSDRWGELNYYAVESKPGLALLHLDEALNMDQILPELRDEMWGEDTFIVRKDGEFGLLYELEYRSIESETVAYGDDVEKGLKPYADVVRVLLKGLKAVQAKFPQVEVCVPAASEIVHDRPAVWAFVKTGTLDAQAREELGILLSTF